MPSSLKEIGNFLAHDKQNISISDIFYETEKVKDETVQVTYKPTTEMSSDYLTKSLTGSLFTKHQATLLGLDSYDKYPIFYERDNDIPDV